MIVDTVVKRTVISNVIHSVTGLVVDPVLPTYVYNFDNVDDYITLDEKIFDPTNPEFELEGYFDLENYDGTLISQNISSTSGNREFQIYKTTSSGIKLVVGGSLRTILNDGTLHNQNGKWTIKLYGNSTDGFDIDVSFNDVLLNTTGWSDVGDAVEAGALPMIAGRSAGSPGTSSSLLGGDIYDLKFWQGGNRATGTLVLDMPINEGGAGSVDNYAGTATATAHNFDSSRWTQVS